MSVADNAMVRLMSRLITPASQRERARQLQLADQGHGYDPFGANADWVALGMGIVRGLYDVWFRVESQGHEHLPAQGPALVVANHSGTLPFDAMMLWSDVARKSEPPRVLRPVADHFVPNLPFVSTLFARTGTVGGSRENIKQLLKRGELVAVFPEGTPGISKSYRKRYQLQDWRVGHAELALSFRVPVIPAAVIGAEEQMPQIGRIPVGAGVFGVPYLPLTLTPLPLPVRYHIRYGAPLLLHELFDASDAAEPHVIEAAASLVADEVRKLIAAGLRERKGVFR